MPIFFVCHAMVWWCCLKVIWASCACRLDKHAQDVLLRTAWQSFKESGSWFDMRWKRWCWDCAMSPTWLWDPGTVGAHARGIAAYWLEMKNMQKHMQRPQSPECRHGKQAWSGPRMYSVLCVLWQSVSRTSLFNWSEPEGNTGAAPVLHFSSNPAPECAYSQGRSTRSRPYIYYTFQTPSDL